MFGFKMLNWQNVVFSINNNGNLYSTTLLKMGYTPLYRHTLSTFCFMFIKTMLGTTIVPDF